MRLVVSLGGNALLRKGQAITAENQRENAAMAAMWLAPVFREHDVVIAHGSGPQLAMLALQSFSYRVAEPTRLDLLCAQAGGETGYLLARELRNKLGSDRHVVAHMAQVLVNADDEAFGKPAKPIGPFYERTYAHQLRQLRGWQFADFDGEYRRVVPVPRLLETIEIGAAKSMLGSGTAVVMCGPVPVAAGSGGELHGMEALPDKDEFASLLARELDADGLLFLTDVLSVATDYGKPEQRQIRQATPASLGTLAFDPSSMGPKVKAACDFVEASHKWAAIGSISNVEHVLSGEAGTRVVPTMAGAIDFWSR
ncbi:amino acid kinase family protein [Aminobacter ciceronei]|jgi:carbamate kinase|uniref:amino acid kinase family protein n=1 Tax=Aminobacter ciceronei TaxID=150723 RepID=UPI003F72BB79